MSKCQADMYVPTTVRTHIAPYTIPDSVRRMRTLSTLVMVEPSAR